jgi:hypothetical protein
MNYTSNYNLNLPQESDFARIAPLNTNFTKIDTVLKENAKAIENVKVPTDQTYNSKSANPQSGIAVAEAIANVKIDVDDTVTEGSTNPVSGGAVKTYVEGKVRDINFSVDKIEDTLDISINLYNKDTNKVGVMIDGGGNETVREEHSTTDYIYLEQGTYYVTGFPQEQYYFRFLSRYDVNKTFKGRTEFTTGSFVMGYEGYVRFSGAKNRVEYIVLSKEPNVTEYVPCEIKIKTDCLPIDAEITKNSTNPVSSDAVKTYVDIETNKLKNRDSINIENSIIEKISFSKENGKLIATIKNGSNDEPETFDALDNIAYEGKSYRDIFITNNLCPSGDFENGLDGFTITNGTPEIVSNIYNSGSHSLRIQSTGGWQQVTKQVTTPTGTVYSAGMFRVDKQTTGKIGLRGDSGGVQNAEFISKTTNGFERVSLAFDSNGSVRFFVCNGVDSDMTAYIDDVVLVSLSTFSTVPDKETMDTLYDNYINIITGKTTDVPSGEPNRFVISGEPFNIANVVEEGNNNPVTSDAVYKALYESEEDNDDTVVESAFDYTKYGMPILYFTGDMTGISKENEVTLNYVYGERSGTCTLKWQGSSSINYPKKNYTVKFDNKFEAHDGWGNQKKYCLKANYIDFSHARNVVSAKLWGKVVKSRANTDTHLVNLANGGAVDGFPVLIVINDIYQGLYTFNIPKDKWMFNVEDGDNCLVLPVDGYSTATGFSALETSLTDDDGKGFEIEYAPDTLTESDVLNRLNTFIGAVVNCNKITDKTEKKSDFEANVKPLMDFESFVDYVIFQSLITGSDNGSKNYILTDYYDNGVDKWIITSYDMDSTYGLSWSGSKYLSINEPVTLKNTKNSLLTLIVSLYPSEVKARYEELRAGVMAESNVQLEFYNFTAGIPKAIKDEECKLWSLIPNTDTNNVNQIVNQYILRCKYIDEQVSKL